MCLKNVKPSRSGLSISLGLVMIMASSSGFAGVKTQIGLGYDDNIYLSPSSDYVDYSLATTPTISPKVHSGTFISYFVDANLEKPTGKNNNYFTAGYWLKGHRYFSNDYQNANRTDNKFNLGVLHRFAQEGKKEEDLKGSILFGHIHRLYLDRDTGENHLLSSNPASADVAARYIYDYTGFEVEYKDRLSAWQKKAGLRWEKRDYHDVPLANETQYDLTYTRVNLGVDKRLSKKTKIGADYSYYTYDYNERKSRDANGTLNGPPRKYTYNKLDFSFRYRQSRAWLYTANLGFKLRDDAYVGYDNYTKTELKLSAQWKNNIHKVKGRIKVWKRDYDNAIAFDEPGQAAKSYDGTTFILDYARVINDKLSFWAKYKLVDENTTDLRYQYTNSIYRAGIEYHI